MMNKYFPYILWPSIIVLGLLSFHSLQAQEDFFCKEGLTIDYTSPVTQEKVKSCQIKQEGKYIKHGPTFYYSLQGQLLRKETYIQDKLEIIPQSSGLSIPNQPSNIGEYFITSSAICQQHAENQIRCLTYSDSKKTPGFRQKFSVQGQSKITSYLSNYHYLCFLEDYRKVFCKFNINNESSLSLQGTFSMAVTHASGGENFICGVLLDKRIECIKSGTSPLINDKEKAFQNGEYFYPSLAIDDKGDFPKSVVLSYADLQHTSLCVLTEKGSVFCQNVYYKNAEKTILTQKDQIHFNRPIDRLHVNQTVYCAVDRESQTHCFQTFAPEERDTPATGTFSKLESITSPGEKTLGLALGGVHHACTLYTDRDLHCLAPGNIFSKSAGTDWGATIADQGNNGNKRFEAKFDSPVKKIISGLGIVCGEISSGTLECFWHYLDKNIYFKNTGTL